MKFKLYKQNNLMYALLLLSVILITLNIYFLIEFQEVEYRASTYERTEFSVIINNPSSDQLDKLDSSENVMKYYSVLNMSVKVEGDSSEEINVLLGLDDSKEIGFFNKNTLIDGDITGNGIELDQKAAKELGVSVGDTVTVYLNGGAFDFEVIAIHMPVTFVGLTNGVANVIASQSILDSFTDGYVVDLTFISANDTTLLMNNELENYVPMGRLEDLESFTETYNFYNIKPINMSETDWNNQIIAEYNIYEDSFLTGDYSGDVHIKSLSGEAVLEQSTETRKTNIILLLGISTLIVALVCYYNTQQLLAGEKFYKDMLQNGGKKYLEYKIRKYFFINYILFIVIAILIVAIFSSILFKSDYSWISYIAILTPYILISLFMYLYVSIFSNKINNGNVISDSLKKKNRINIKKNPNEN